MAASAAIVLASAVATTGFVAISPANALSANCKSNIYKENHFTGDTYYAGAYCYSVGSDTKVRAKLVRVGGPDAEGVWFTGTYIWRYSPKKTCYLGCRDSYDLGER